MYFHNYIFSNVEIPTIYTAIKASALLALFSLVVKPILKILLLPINIITLGSFKLIIETLGLYTTSYFISDLKVNDIRLYNTILFGVNLPNINLTGFFAYLGTSLSLAVIIYIFSLILYKKPQL